MSFRNIFIFCTFTVILSDQFVFAQGDSYLLQPRIFMGAEAGYFRISFNRFHDVYENRWGPIQGAHGGINVYSRYYLTVKFRQFEKDGKEGFDSESGQNLNLAHWDEKWYTLGVRINSPTDRKWNSYYGFGYAFFEVNEQAGLSIYNDSTSEKKTGGGFFLELGVERAVLSRASLFVELEISSAGVGGRAGLEGQSIGGYNLSAGLTLWLF